MTDVIGLTAPPVTTTLTRTLSWAAASKSSSRTWPGDVMLQEMTSPKTMSPSHGPATTDSLPLGASIAAGSLNVWSGADTGGAVGVINALGGCAAGAATAGMDAAAGVSGAAGAAGAADAAGTTRVALASTTAPTTTTAACSERRRRADMRAP
jgi:hypothetical protein